jgi:putative FmdB family regulatory protein
MPIYEYVAERCARQPVCSRRKEYFQHLSEPALTECRECGAAIRRIFSAFAARSGEVGRSTPDPTPLNITGLPAPSDMGDGSGGEGSCGHDH